MKGRVWIGVLLCLIVMLSGCSGRMSTEERVGLYANGSLEQNSADISIEEVEQAEMPTLTVKSELYPEEELVRLFFGEEVNLTGNYYEKDGMVLSIGIDFFLFSMKREMCPYIDSVSTVYQLIYDMDTVLTDQVRFDYDQIKTVFSAEVEEEVRASARKECDAIAQQLGFSLEESMEYKLDVENLSKIQEINNYGINAPGEKPGCTSAEVMQELANRGLIETVETPRGRSIQYLADETVIEEAEREIRSQRNNLWTKEWEAYLFLYKKSYENQIVESVSDENLLWIVYHPELGVLSTYAGRSNLTDIVEKKEHTSLLSGEEAVALANAHFSEKNISDAKIEQVKLCYMAPEANGLIENGSVLLEPCWKVKFQHTIEGKEVTNHILIHAVTGMIADNEVKY